MNFLENIYACCPIPLQHLLCSARGAIVCRRRYNRNFKKYLGKYERHEYRQEQFLRSFLQNIRDVPFYQRQFLEHGINLNGADIYAEIAKLPVLSKNTVKEKISEFVNTQFRGAVISAHTSGTTGSGLVFPYSVEMENRQWAVWWRYRRMNGVDFNTWCGWFGGRTIILKSQTYAPYYRLNIFGKQVMFSAYHLNLDTVVSYYEAIKSRALPWLHGYPSQLAFLASLIREKGLPPLNCVKIISCGAENLLSGQMAVINGCFPDARVIQHYGLAEGVANISQYPDGTFRVDEDFCYVEFIPLSEADPSICRIVGTGFCNEAFPLVRYDTGDIAHIRHLPDGRVEILSIDGRCEDYLTLPNGVRLGRLDHIFKDFPEVREAQIHQLDLTHIEVNIVKMPDYSSATEKRLTVEFLNRIGEEVNIIFRYKEKLSRTTSGKLKFVISEVKQ